MGFEVRKRRFQGMLKPMEPTNPWDGRYGGEDFFYGIEPNDFLRQEAGRLPGRSRVLCLAEGEGRNAVYLAQLGHRVTAVDGSAVGLAKLGRLAAKRGVEVETVHADLGEFDFKPEGWDSIVSVWCHLPPALRRDVHAKCVAALAPGGLFLLEAYTPRQLTFRTGGPPVAELMMTLEDLRIELSGLEFLRGEELDREIHEGRGHEGQSAVVQVVARRG